jgi:hypothetical protein
MGTPWYRAQPPWLAVSCCASARALTRLSPACRRNGSCTFRAPVMVVVWCCCCCRVPVSFPAPVPVPVSVPVLVCGACAVGSDQGGDAVCCCRYVDVGTSPISDGLLRVSADSSGTPSEAERPLTTVVSPLVPGNLGSPPFGFPSPVVGAPLVFEGPCWQLLREWATTCVVRLPLLRPAWCGVVWCSSSSSSSVVVDVVVVVVVVAVVVVLVVVVRVVAMAVVVVVAVIAMTLMDLCGVGRSAVSCALP